VNEPNATTCRACGQPVPRQVPLEISRPPLGVLRLSTGAVVTLDRGVVIGRDPVIPEHSRADHPNTLRVASPERDVSRTHLEVVLERWHVLVRDLGSTNGTVITQPGQPPLRLRPEEPQLLEPGAVVIMADEISFVFEVSQ
jgi:pSer/pThr/pTyr-binding forkhead associated (FHA) protein